MNLLQQAAIDLRAELEDSTNGFASSCVVTSPDGETATFSGIFRKIDKAIDPQTGELISSSTASIVLSKVSLDASGMGEIQNIMDEERAPWLVSIAYLGEPLTTYKVSDVPTDCLGAVTCMLEAYEPI